MPRAAAAFRMERRASSRFAGVGCEDGASHEGVDRALPEPGRIALQLFQDFLDGHDGLPTMRFYFDPGRFPARWVITHEKSSAPNPAAVAPRRSS